MSKHKGLEMQTVESPAWSALAAGIDGRVVLPGSPEYETVRLPFIARFDDIRPQAVVQCRSVGDVAEAVRFGRRHGIHAVPRSGGHSFAGYSSGEGMIVDLSPMNDVVVRDGVAHVGAGASLGHLAAQLITHGLAIPSGACPTVGIGGTTLGGGHGVLGRLYGLACDHLVGAEVVLADGTVVECDEHHHEDLFWGLRGAGGGHFGVVTRFRFRPRPALAMTSFYLTWTFEHAARVGDVWQRWAPWAPREVAAALAFDVPESMDARARVELFGAILGTESDARALLQEPLDRIGAPPATEFIGEMPYRETMLYQSGLLILSGSQFMEVSPEGVLTRQGCRFTKSELFDRPVPAEGMEALAAAFLHERVEGEYRGLELGPWGGAIADLAVDATAFAHRDQMISIKHSVLVAGNAGQAAKQAALDWANHSYRSVHPWGTGFVYPNFPDPEIEDWPRAYHGANFERLVKVKARYDPDDVFHFPQSIPRR